MLNVLDDYSWKEAFGYAGEPDTSARGDGIPMVPLGCASVSVEPFNRDMVIGIVHIVEGENDGPAWIIAGKLHDGRWFFLNAGCDSTGWDCQASGEASVAKTYMELVRFAMTDDDRERFGIANPPVDVSEAQAEAMIMAWQIQSAGK